MSFTKQYHRLFTALIFVADVAGVAGVAGIDWN